MGGPHLVRRSSRGRLHVRGRSLVRDDPLLLADILRRAASGEELWKISDATGVTEACIRKHVHRATACRPLAFWRGVGRRQGCSLDALPQPLNHGGPRIDTLGHGGREMLLQLIEGWRTLSYERYARFMSRYLGRVVTPDTIGKTARSLGYTRKKLTKVYLESLTPRILRKQKEHRRWVERSQRNDRDFTDDLYYLDISAFRPGLDFYGSVGLSQRGIPAVEAQPSGRGKTYQLVMAINRTRGVVAPVVFEGHANHKHIELYFKHALLPQLSPGDIIIADNASYWKGRYVARPLLRPLLRAAGVGLRYLPPRSPLLNPIEKVFGILKRALRGNPAYDERRPHTAINAAVNALSVATCASFIDALWPKP